jgi:hypothetical protein
MRPIKAGRRVLHHSDKSCIEQKKDSTAEEQGKRQTQSARISVREASSMEGRRREREERSTSVAMCAK